MEDGCLSESLLNECASLPVNFITIVTLLEGVVAYTNEAMSRALLSLYLHTAYLKTGGDEWLRRRIASEARVSAALI